MVSHPHFLWTDLFRRGKSNQQNMACILRENILFHTLARQEIAYLTSIVYERIYQPNEVIFHQNDRGLGMYMIAAGQVSIKSETPQGEVQITRLSEGSFFGEMALVDPDNVRTASAEALERTVLVGFFISDLQEILDRKPVMGVKILLQLAHTLGRRLSETTEKMTQTSPLPKYA